MNLYASVLHNFRPRYPDEISCFFLAVTSFAYDTSCLFGRMILHAFWMPNFLFDAVM